MCFSSSCNYYWPISDSCSLHKQEALVRPTQKLQCGDKRAVFFFCFGFFFFFHYLSYYSKASVITVWQGNFPKHYITGKEIIFHFQHNLIRKKSRFSNSLESSVCTVCLHQFQYVIYDSLIELFNKTIRKLQTWKFGKR